MCYKSEPDRGNTANWELQLPDWVLAQVSKRRQEMVDDPMIALSHDDVCRRIEARNRPAGSV